DELLRMLHRLGRLALVVAEKYLDPSAEDATLGVDLVHDHLDGLPVRPGEWRPDAAERVDLADADRRLRRGRCGDDDGPSGEQESDGAAWHQAAACAMIAGSSRRSTSRMCACIALRAASGSRRAIASWMARCAAMISASSSAVNSGRCAASLTSSVVSACVT